MCRRFKFVFMSMIILMLAGCSSKGQVMDGPGMMNSYRQISQEEAKKMMEQDDGHIIVDVRRQDEYDSGHIPGAILIPNESIGDTQPEELPDPDQVILIYCRSGNRSKQAADKLFQMGYKNIYEFGGINTWDGEIITEQADKEAAAETQPESAEQEEKTMRMIIGETKVPVTWENNDSVAALKDLLPLEISMSMYGGFEQVGPIGKNIPGNDKQMATDYGDIVLYSGNQIVIFYGGNSWAYTRLGHVDLPQKEMTNLLGNGDVILTIAED